MITEIDRIMRSFEQRSCSPGKIKKAADFLGRMIGGKLNKEIIQEIQKQRLTDVINYIYINSSYYRAMFKSIGALPGDFTSMEDLHKLPFTTAKDIHHWEDFLCVKRDKLSAVFTTSGTTGEPKKVFYAYHEMQMLTNLFAVALRLVQPGPIIGIIALPISHGLWIGSASAHRAIERAGGLPIPVGADNPQETLKWMERFNPNLVFSSPSYMTALTREAERADYRAEIEIMVLAGELLTPEQKKHFKSYWGAQVFDIYGSTEIGSAQTIALPKCTAFHINDLHLVTEIVNPVTGEPDDQGELVFTTLRREAMPLLRYKSGDRGRRAACDCGLPFSAIQLAGRIDDMIIVGDMNLYGRIIADAVAKVKGTTGRMSIHLEKTGLTDKLVLNIEGKDINKNDVKQVLFASYPELKVNSKNGNLILVIETGVNLGNQIKDIKITDNRNK